MLQGKLSAPATLGGALQGGAGLQGTLAGGGSIHPVYDGATEFTPTESAQTIGTEGKVVLTDLTVDAVPSTYVGSAVDRRDSDDLAASGATVTAPAGYYAEPASKAVASGSITMRRPTMDEAVGEVRSRADVTAGYVAGGSYGGSALILDKQAGTTITPTESEQVAVAQYRWTTGAVKVAAIPSQYIVPTGTYTVTGGGTHDVTEYASASVASATPTNSSDSEYITSSGSRKWRYRPKTIVPTAGWADQHSASNPINGFWVTYDAIPTGTTVTPTASAQTIGGADTMMEGAVTVAAMPSGSVTPDTPTVDSSNGAVTVGWYQQAGHIPQGSYSATFYDALSTQGAATITPSTSAQTAVAAGKYTTGAVTVAAMPTGTAGTPTASKGAVSNHSVSVTPSVTNTAGYIAGGTLTGTAVSVSASELVSGTKSITASGTHDVTEYASASVAAGSATMPSSMSGSGTIVGALNNTMNVQGTITATPQVSAGYVSAGTSGSTSVSLQTSVATLNATTYSPQASDRTIAAGTYTIGTQTIKGVTMANLDAGNIKDGVTVKIGDSTDDDCVASVTGTYTGGGSSVKTATGTFTGNGTRTIDVACTFEPDIVYFTSNPGTTASSGTVAAIIVRDMMTATRYRNNSTTNSHYAIPGIADLNTSGSSYSWRATYANSKVTLYCYSSNARGLLTNGRTYSYTFIKWT